MLNYYSEIHTNPIFVMEHSISNLKRLIPLSKTFEMKSWRKKELARLEIAIQNYN